MQPHELEFALFELERRFPVKAYLQPIFDDFQETYAVEFDIKIKEERFRCRIAAPKYQPIEFFIERASYELEKIVGRNQKSPAKYTITNKIIDRKMY